MTKTRWALVTLAVLVAASLLVVSLVIVVDVRKEEVFAEESLVCGDHRVLVRERRGPRAVPRAFPWHVETRYLCVPEGSLNA